MRKYVPSIVMEHEKDPVNDLRGERQLASFRLNSEWLEQNAAEVFSRFRGKCICIAGRELFASDSVEEAIAQANSAHPEDDGWFTRIIPKERAARVYAL